MKSILDEAQEIVNGSRQAAYGSPEDCFELIGKLWSAYMGRPVSRQDVCCMMSLLKIARSRDAASQNRTKRDNWVDLAGYAECGSRCAETQRQEQTSQSATTGTQQPPAGAPKPPDGWRLLAHGEVTSPADMCWVVDRWIRVSLEMPIQASGRDRSGYYWARKVED